ncbi:carbohydrate ABC transporter permease [Cellulomonas fimi]|uniref:Binding-protein-dependent transport systems inner membrane component n=1 Tax=Cellulomonas fimi (strain ATCC 484 / DSM 20113 / JCM 1341 / CCUG 24087 / LMG 16345 / NBRC 15513 / NCIMB 8980 / NCTC 7547 / NRS-133) TaxID=590998 RepID=F4H3S1_CELFA|nr:sugar ABC transporter permease [Cellulomonas fimi]AEE47737.1 binding-protein-dependent transport systems inner membrane component [Cellulomonas fimi ATCC 484]NNH06724.1 sugar ABC transporter permease [Cellulomonas fimi]VEH36903.1 sn-glycerol-3-phosphate transport system permease protein ugpA [Cellulomonas fimi]
MTATLGEAFGAARATSPRRPGGRSAPRQKLTRRRKVEARYFWLFISPWLIGFVGFLLGPMIASVYISLTEWDSFTPPQFVGFDNYTRALTDDPIFWKALGNTFFYALVSVPLGLVIGVWLANLLNKKVRGRKLFRTFIYLPTLVPLVATAMVFKMVLAPSGPLNDLLGVVGVQGPDWLLDPTWVKPALVVLSAWGAGGATVLLLSAMNGIPKEFYEAAEIDGAGPIRQFWSITFPQITPIIFFNLIMGLIGAFQIFGQVYILTSGGPDNASMMMVPLLFREAFSFYHFGYASAIAWLLFLVIIVFTIIAFRTSKKWVFYETEVR